MMMLWLVVLSLVASLASASADDVLVDTGPISAVVLDGPNVCIDQREENRTVNVTYLLQTLSQVLVHGRG